MKIKTICTLLFFLFIGIGTRICAQTNAVLNYPMPAKKQVSTQKQNKQYTGTEVKRHTYNTIDNNINTTDTILHKKNTSEEKIKQGLSTIGDGMEQFMERESEAIGRIAGKAEKNGKKFLKKISDAGKRFGNKVGTTLNNASDAVSDRQINKKK
ncbi:serum opacity factor [Prevotella pallens]|uniref:serum opacity factor n=1 Tax=Prevotella pallens TaxID=60133 RepID=UPI001CAC88B8|nr:serum opacity factor [Prevotella pallens]MBF1502248.1 serum opacity factor [Prevotella pallens]